VTNFPTFALDKEPTSIPRNIHKPPRNRPYSVLIMRGAFVVQLRVAGQSTAGGMEGSVEEVDTGKQIHFRSGDELIEFLQERFAQSCQSVPPKDGIKAQ